MKYSDLSVISNYNYVYSDLNVILNYNHVYF